MTAITDMQRDVEDFVDYSNVLPFVMRVNVCHNTGKHMMEYEDGTIEEFVKTNKDAGQEY